MGNVKSKALERLQSFQMERYLKASHFDDPKNWDIKSTDYTLAFESLMTLPIDELGRGSRSTLANRILRILLCTNMVSLANITAHLSVLELLLRQPSKSMCILNNMEVPTKEKSQQKYRNEIALLEIARNIDLFAHWSIDYTNSVKILRQLSRCILRQGALMGKATAAATDHCIVIFFQL